jgi:release factor glutamine methyltransferase
MGRVKVERGRDSAAITVAAAIIQLTKALWDADLDSPSLDARILVGEALHASAEDLIRDPDRVLSASERTTLQSYTTRRLGHEPVSRILGRRGFYGRMFEVTPATLDPRPDTETLIDAALEIATERGWRNKPVRILDVGVGTGCILITLLAELPNAIGFGVDVSPSALEIAIRNARAIGVSERASFRIGDSLKEQSQPFDLIVSNPPYIPAAVIDTLDPEVRNFDPRLALDGGADGLDVYRALAQGLETVLPCGAIVVEVGAGQATVVAGLLAEATGPRSKAPRFWTDLGGHVRCVAVETQHQPSQSKTL